MVGLFSKDNINIKDNIFESVKISLNKINDKIKELKHIESNLYNDIINLNKLVAKVDGNIFKISVKVQ